MRVIYAMTNKVNYKVYVGQTNNFHLRMNGHRSNANNPNSHAYTSPLSNAIRKYGWGSFDNRVIEEFNDEESQEYIDSREKFFIAYYGALTSQYGHNIALGGAGIPKEKLSYSQKTVLSKLFTPEQIYDIQMRIKRGEKYPTIAKVYPKLTASFFSNINTGLNFRNDDWEYPLHDYKNDMSVNFSLDDMHLIKTDIINGYKYADISKKWGVSVGVISMVNNGKMWYEKEYSYPLHFCNNSRIHNANTWVKDVQQDLIKTRLTIKEISNKYCKSFSTIKKINSGASHRNSNFKYPLTSNRT